MTGTNPVSKTLFSENFNTIDSIKILVTFEKLISNITNFYDY
jgi:hypothetical protein